MRKQFIPTPRRSSPEPPASPIISKPESPSEIDRITASVHLARALIVVCGADKKTRAVCRAVARIYGITVGDLMGPRRLKRFIEPRHVAMTIARELLDYMLIRFSHTNAEGY